MPTPHHLKNLAVIGNRYTLREAAAHNLLLALRCTHCRRPPVVFLATDLVQVLDPQQDCFHPPPFPCSRCGRGDRIEVRIRNHDDAAVGHLRVRRLKGIRQVPQWADELLGDSPP